MRMLLWQLAYTMYVCIYVTIAHILNGCSAYKGLYIACHDRIVALLVKELRNNVNFTTIHYNEKLKMDWFSLPHKH